jgi:ATP-dependent Lhr-like helicase
VQTTDDGIMLRLPALSGTPPLDVLRGLTAEEAERRVLEELGASSLFGSRFRMNAARALLLPRGSPRRRMPLWLQRLRAQDLLQTVRDYPSFPILVETYRDVLQDAFDMPALAQVLQSVGAGAITIRDVETQAPSPFASSLQLGFVMDWMYADDSPRAERRAALLSLDRALLDELLGGAGADDATLAALDELLAIRRGTAPERHARTADELAVLLDRAGELTLVELRERVAPRDPGSADPVMQLLESGRVVGVELPNSSGGPVSQRLILTEAYPRYVAAFGPDALARVYVGATLEPKPAAEAIPSHLREGSLTVGAARRELLSRFLALAGPVSADEILRRYDFPRAWVEQRLDDWAAAGKLVRGSFARGGESADDSTTRWCSRRLLEHARRRELAAARRQIEAVGFPTFAHFLQRWQHLDPSTRLEGAEGTTEVLRQLYGIARPAAAWEREYLRNRVNGYDADTISRLSGKGELVWVGASSLRPDDTAGAPATLGALRFLKRGSARAWLSDGELDREQSLHEHSRTVLAALKREGASFFEDLRAATSLSGRALRDALRELVASGLVTNDTAESLRQVVRWRPLVSPRVREQPDPTRWLPAEFTPSGPRPVVQRRANVRRLPRWKPPTADGVDAYSEGWPGRWSLVRTAGILGPEGDERALAEQVARQWLDRYGVVARDWWRRERPAIPWRAIYQELKRLEFRGDVRRGYFVRGLAGVQFALPAAVEMLRTSGPTSTGDGRVPEASSIPVVVLASSDPANPYSLPQTPNVGERIEGPSEQLARGRHGGALLLTRAGEVVLVAESHGRTVLVRENATQGEVAEAARALAKRLTEVGARRHDPLVETIDGMKASTSSYAAAFVAAGFRITSSGLRYYAPPG